MAAEMAMQMPKSSWESLLYQTISGPANMGPSYKPVFATSFVKPASVEPPKPDSLTQSVLDKAAAERAGTVAEKKVKADADEIKATEAKSLVLEWVKRGKEAAEVAKRKELEADLAQRKLMIIKKNIRDLMASTVTETAVCYVDQDASSTVYSSENNLEVDSEDDFLCV